MAAAAGAHADDCASCVIGIWDDPALTSTSGSIVVGAPKDVYIGVLLTNGDTEFSGLELSVTGLNVGTLFLLGAEALGPRALVFGSVPAPPDTSAQSEGVGGANFAWTQAVDANVGVVRLTLFATGTVNDHMLMVKRSYPPLNAEYRTPLVIRADSPAFSKMRVGGGCYVLNPSSQVATDCATLLGRTDVEVSTWSAVKTMFR